MSSEPRSKIISVFIALCLLCLAAAVVSREVSAAFVDIINGTSANGIAVYSENTNGSPRYNWFNDSWRNFTAQQYAQDTGANMLWLVSKSAYKRDEFVLVTQDINNDVYAQVMDSSRDFSQLQSIATNVPNSAYRAFDLAYTDISDIALLAYENDTVVDRNVMYRIWNGTGFSEEYNVTVPIETPVNWVGLYSKPGTNQMMMIVLNTLNDLAAIPWNGTRFDVALATNLTVSASSTTQEVFHFSWQSSSGIGVAVYGDGSNLAFRNFTGSAWGPQANVFDAGQNLVSVRSCSDPNSDFVGIILEDAGNDVNVRMYNGTAFVANPPAQDASSEDPGANNVNTDCVWLRDTNRAIFAYVDSNNPRFKFFNFSRPVTWSVASLTNAPLAPLPAGSINTPSSYDIKGLKFVPSPVNDEAMVVIEDFAEHITMQWWNKTMFDNVSATPLSTVAQSINADQTDAYFDWYRLDPPPNVTRLSPNGTNFLNNAKVGINATVIDNVNVSAVYANVTLPNGSFVRVSMTDSDQDSTYNGTFIQANQSGWYYYTIVANDTSLHLNYNDTQSASFSVGDSLQPNVTIDRPAAGSIYNYSFNVTIRANVTDNYNVSFVFANVTLPSGANFSVAMVRLDNNITYEGNFSATVYYGFYRVQIVANDTSGNKNASVFTNFSVRDSLQPNVTLIRPVAGSHFNVSDTVAIRVNASDDVNISSVYANTTLPNGSVVQDFLVKGLNNVTFEVNFTQAVMPGFYSVLFWANDTSNNTNSSVATNFTVDDRLPPNVTIDHPPESSTYNRSDNVTIRANVTDDVNVSAVLANVTLPDAGYQVVVMVRLGSTSTFEVNFSNTSASGAYLIRIVANDTSGNLNATESRAFTVRDESPPNVTFDYPPVASTYNRSQNVTIRANVTDDVNVSYVFANVTSPVGVVTAVQMVRLADNVTYEANFSGTAVAGTYTAQIVANDTYDNVNASVSRTFFVNDFTPPNVTIVSPASGARYNISQNVTLQANVSDDFNVSAVYFNVTLPNGSTYNRSAIVLANGLTYEANFSMTVMPGPYVVRVIANDTSNNVNDSVAVTFYVDDRLQPNVTFDQPPADSTYNRTYNVTIRANVSDDVNVSYVSVNVTSPDGVVDSIVMIRLGSTSTYEANFSNTTLPGPYVMLLFANDTSGNVNGSVARSFSVDDRLQPNVTLDSPASDSRYNVSANVTIRANVSDDVNVSMVYANVTLPNGSVYNLTLSRAGLNVSYENNFSLTVKPGPYIVRIIANDSSNNVNDSVTVTFYVDDRMPPNVSILLPADGAAYNRSQNVTIRANVTDDVNVSSVRANVSLPDGALELLDMVVLANGVTYEVNFSSTLLEGLYVVTIVANDTSNNLNASVNVTFRVNDFTPPNVTFLRPLADSVFNRSDNVTILANVTDPSNVSYVFANVTMPNGSVQALEMVVLADGAGYEANFSNTGIAGSYLVQIVANDSLGNVNASVSRAFSLKGFIPPNVTIVAPSVGSTYNLSANVTIQANVTSLYNVSYVYANVTLPNGSFANVTMVLLADDVTYEGNFSLTRAPGPYIIRIVANDSLGNLNDSETRSFSVDDRLQPNVTFVAPAPGARFNRSDRINILANVSDDVNVSVVLANVTMPNGTVDEVEMVVLANGRTYEGNFTNSGASGAYVIRIVANDTSNNVNASVFRTVYVEDFTPPNVTSLFPADGSRFNRSDIVVIRVNVTDDYNVSYVFANITDPLGSVSALAMSVLADNATYTVNFTSTLYSGAYVIQIVANDTKNNVNASVKTTFIIDDFTPPNVTILLPALNSAFNLTDWVLIRANVSDDYNVSFVYANVTLPNGSVHNVTMIPSPDNLTYEGNFTQTLRRGKYIIRIIANDTLGNVNDSVTRNFSVAHDVPPNVTVVSPLAGAKFNISDNVTIQANVTDPFNVSMVYVNVTLPNGSVRNITLLALDDNITYEGNFSETSSLGTYTILFIANDSLDNVNDTVSTYFIIGDFIRPSVVIDAPASRSSYNLFQNVTIRANVTDDFNVSDVFANVTMPNSSSVIVDMVRLENNVTYEGNFTSLFLPGPYVMRIVANDTNGNVNGSETRLFFGLDLLPPNVTLLSPSPGAAFNRSQNVTIRANVTDDVNVSSVVVNVTLPNGSIRVSAMVELANQATYEVNFSETALFGVYYLRVIASDTSNNSNSSAVSNFSVNDFTPPNVTITSPAPGAHFNVSQNVTIRANVSDFVSISRVYADVTLPNGSVSAVSMVVLADGVAYEGNFTSVVMPGPYIIRVIANDSVGNVNASQNITILVDDRLPPNVTITSPVENATYVRKSNVTLWAVVTDDVNVSLVYANITLPNGSVQNVSLLVLADAKTYEGNFSGTVIPGPYMMRVIANDTSGNVNDSQTVRFFVSDQLRPNVTIDQPPAGSAYNRSQNVTVRANVTDDVNVSVVFANFTLPNGSFVVSTMVRLANEVTYEANFSQTVWDGAYSFKIFANDTSGNVNYSVSRSFSVNDFTAPNVTVDRPAAGTNYTRSSNVTIRANVTDAYNVSVVLANVSMPNGSLSVLTMVRLADGVTYEANFSNTGLDGRYDVRIVANDTRNNVNATRSTYFSIKDFTPPNVTAVSPADGAYFNRSANVTISANVTDAYNVSSVDVNVTLPNGSVRVSSMTRLANNVTYEVNFSETVLDGPYTVYFIASDVEGNVNSSVTLTFHVRDFTAPNVTIISPSPGAYLNRSVNVTIRANVTDSYNVSSVFANVTLPNSTVRSLPMVVLANGVTYEANLSETGALGPYRVLIVANDTAGNVNASVNVTFIVNDTIAPALVVLTPSQGQKFNYTGVVNMTAGVSDNVGVDTVLVEVLFPNGSTVTQELVFVAGVVYQAYFDNLTQQGFYNLTFTANDTYGNVNVSRVYFERTPSDANLIDVYDEYGARLIFPSVDIVNNVSGVYDLNITTQGQEILEMLIFSHAESSPWNLIRIANRSNESNMFESTYLVDFSEFNMTRAEITVNATGQHLYKCTQVNVTGRSCYDAANYTHVRADLVPGQLYRFNLTDGDPVFGETLEGPNSTSDSWLDEGQPGKNNGAQDFMRVGSSPGGDARRAVVWFNMSLLPAGIAVDNSTLQLYLFQIPAGDSTASRTHALHRIQQSPARAWVEMNVSWANYTDSASWSSAGGDFRAAQSANATYDSSSIGGFISFNVTADVIDFYANSSFNFGWVLKDVDEASAGAQRDYRTSEWSDSAQRPLLAVTFRDVAAPAVRDAVPADGASFVSGVVLNISANVTDVFNMSNVSVNVTLPNGTVRSLILQNWTKDVFNATFSETSINGTYLIRFIANDTEGNVNASVVSTVTILETAAPAVVITSPLQGDVFNQTDVVNISASVTDDVGVSYVLANVTFPNQTRIVMQLLRRAGTDVYTANLTNTSPAGSYSVRAWANDSSGNSNSSVLVSFTVQDVVAPSVVNLTPNGTNYSIDTDVNLSAAVSDLSNISYVFANVTSPSGSVSAVAMLDPDGDGVYNGTFTSASIGGRFNFTVVANDSYGNVNATESGYFNVGETAPPSINLNGPVSGFNTSSSSIDFNFTAIDSSAPMNCSLLLNGSVYLQNTSVPNGTATVFYAAAFTQGHRSWNVSCTDTSSNSNSSPTYRFVIDQSPPIIKSIASRPASEAELDPGINITIFANITDNLTAVGAVILGFKVESASDFTNSTMVYNSSAGSWAAWFNASASGTYNVRVFANDTVGNAYQSGVVNISVQFDDTWTREPSSFLPVVASFNDVVEIGNLSVNDSGDYVQNFTVNSSSANSTYNESAAFGLLAKAWKGLRINDTASVAGLKSMLFNISVSSLTASPSSLTTSASIVVAPGQPVITTSFIVPPAAITVTQGDSNIPFTVELQNLGSGNATNITMDITLPSGWLLTSGSLNFTFAELEAYNSIQRQIVVTIPSDATVGIFDVVANVTAKNETGADLGALNLTFGSTRQVKVNAYHPVTPQTSGGSGGGGGGAGGSAGMVMPPITPIPPPFTPPNLTQTLRTQKFLSTVETIELVRGEGASFPLKVTNVFENTTLFDVRMSLGGYHSQYMSSYPGVLNGVSYGAAKEFMITLESASYFKAGTYKVMIIINGSATGSFSVDRNGTLETVNTIVDFVENRDVTLIIHEMEFDEAKKLLEDARRIFSEMDDGGLPLVKATSLLESAQNAFDTNNWSQLRLIVSALQELRDDAFNARSALLRLGERIVQAKKEGIDVKAALEVQRLAKAAFDREDFALALRRAQEGLLLGSMEVSGMVASPLTVASRYWWAAILLIAVAWIAGAKISRMSSLAAISRRMQALTAEEVTIKEEILQLQQQAFKAKTMSTETFHKKMALLQRRLEEVRSQRVLLRERRARLVSAAQWARQLKMDGQLVGAALRSAKKEYFMSRSISQNAYAQRVRQANVMGAEIAEENELLEEERRVAFRRDQRIEDFLSRIPFIRDSREIKTAACHAAAMLDKQKRWLTSRWR